MRSQNVYSCTSELDSLANSVDVWVSASCGANKNERLTNAVTGNQTVTFSGPVIGPVADDAGSGRRRIRTGIV